MKSIKSALLFLILFGCFYQLFSNDTEYRKAYADLAKMGEVYFRFGVNNLQEINALDNVISIDEVTGHEVYAFANPKEFEAFLNYDHYYKVLTPPGLEGPRPEMSDYADLDNLQWDKYPTFSGYKNMMHGFASKYPDKVKIYNIGTSINGRDLLVAKVSDNVEEEECEPEWFMMGAIHGNETMGSIICLRLIEYLCESYERDERAHRILDSVEMYILPFSNPDATYRSGDDNIYGAVRENANGKDLNRNWPKMPGTGTSQSPEKETRNIMAFEKEHNFVMNIDYHAGVETAIYPYSSISRRTPDDAWWKYATRVYADLVQENSPSGYYNDCDNGICHGYSQLGYVAIGTTKDWFYYHMSTRGISNELTSTKLVPESKLEDYWDYNIDGLLAYIQEALNGFRGTVVDEVTKVGLAAKVFVEDHDKVGDSSWVYADSSGGHGNYYRPIYQGNYDVTFSCEGCDPKTVDNISVQNGKATIVNVELDCGSTDIINNFHNVNTQISIVSFGRGIKINCGNLKGIVNAAVYDMNGKLVKTLPIKNGVGTLVWNGLNNGSQPVSSGCYIFQIQAADKKISQSFVLSN